MSSIKLRPTGSSFPSKEALCVLARGRTDMANCVDMLPNRRMHAGGLAMQSFVGVVIGDQIREIVFPRILLTGWLNEWPTTRIAGWYSFVWPNEQKKQVVGD